MNESHSPRKTGIEAEKVVANILVNKGWRIIATNYRSRYGEIDIVAQEVNTLVFLEVKSASRLRVGLVEKVNLNKQRKLIKTASRYLQEFNCDGYEEIRFDVVGVFKGTGSEWRIDHIRNAFEPENHNGGD